MKPSPRFLLLPAFLMVVSLACSLVTPGLSPTPSVQGETPVVPTTVPPTAVPAEVPHGKIAYASERDGLWQIIAMNADGSDEVPLTASFGQFSRPSWSPDGNRIGMRMDNPTLGIAVMDVRHENGRLAGSQPIAVNSLFSDGPSWSPDGQSLVYSSTQDNSGWRTFVSDTRSNETRQITDIPENATDPTWSPDGTRLAFTWYTDEHQTRDLYLINLDGTGMVNITNTPNVNEMGPAWSRDGSKIAFSGAIYAPDGANSPSDIFIINPDGSGLEQLTRHPEADFDPAWSPDGKQLAFVSDRDSSNDSNYEIYQINADGTGEMRLTNNHSTDRWPSWRADLPEDGIPAACQPGFSLLADVTIPQGTRFAQPQPFTKIWRVKNIGNCTWTPASYRLVSTPESWTGGESLPIPGAIQPGAVVDISVPLNPPKAPGSYTGGWQLVDGSGQPVPNADGNAESLPVQIEVLASGQNLLPKPLYFATARTQDPQIWRMETDARTTVQVTNEPLGVKSFAVSKDGRIAYITETQLIVMDSSGANRQLLADGLDGPTTIAWSVDGTQLAYSKGGIHIRNIQTGEDNLVLEDFDTSMPGLLIYEPVAWSPDGSKLTTRVYQWEGAVMNMMTAQGSVLAEFPFTTSAWSRDSQSVYYSGVGSEGMMSQIGGLWMLPSDGGKPETLVSDADVWAPTQAPDGSLYYFAQQTSSPLAASGQDRVILLTRADASGGGAAPVASQPLLIQQNDTFTVGWSQDASSYVAQFIRPSLNVTEVLLYNVDGSPPLFLMQEVGPFQFGP